MFNLNKVILIPLHHEKTHQQRKKLILSFFHQLYANTNFVKIFVGSDTLYQILVIKIFPLVFNLGTLHVVDLSIC